MMLRVIALATLLCLPALAQPAPPARKFEVASVKLHEGPMRSIGVYISGTRIHSDASTVRSLIMFAYNVRNFQVSDAGPEMQNMGNVFYDVVAKAEGDTPPTRDEFRMMMRHLLAERFKLKLRLEPQEMTVYDVVVAKNGPKLKDADADAQSSTRIGPEHPEDRNYRILMPRATIPALLERLQDSGAFPNSPVRDKTGLTGTYNIQIFYTPDFRFAKGLPEPEDIPVFTALQNQLGLKVEKQKAVVDIWVVDHVQQPSSN
jgi:uncharacterized protein (TIGR03435 family)